MKAFIIRAAFLFFILVPIAHAALVRLGTSDAMAAADSIHLTNIPKSMGFGRVKKVTSKSIKIKNNGTASASVTLVPPSAPFAVSSGGGSFTLAPKGTQHRPASRCGWRQRECPGHNLFRHRYSN